MGTIRAQPAKLPIPLTLTPPPQQLVLPLWRWEEPAEAPPLLPVPNDEVVCVALHQVWTQLSPTQQFQLRRALLQVLQEVVYDPARQS
ncbi:MAG: hypothetical protein ACLQUY_22845 [Ktedonobacterales bacterium]